MNSAAVVIEALRVNIAKKADDKICLQNFNKRFDQSRLIILRIAKHQESKQSTSVQGGSSVSTLFANSNLV